MSSFIPKVSRLLPYPGEEMSCNATLVMYNDSHQALIEELDIDNPESHLLVMKSYVRMHRALVAEMID